MSEAGQPGQTGHRVDAGRAVPPRAREQHAAHAIALRVMINVILTTQAAVLEGTLGRVSRTAISDAAAEMCIDIIESLR